jgi:hypothetical protein
MTDRHSNEEFNFGSLAGAFADESPVKKESAGPAKITRSNVKATAPAVEAVVTAVDAASAPALPAMPAASMPPMPEVQNPAQTGSFWGSAMASALPSIAAGSLGAAALAAYNKFGNRGQGGQGLQAPPTVDEDLRQLRLAQEQAKLDAMYAKMNRQQELHEANLAKAQPKAPVAPVAPPAAPTGVPSAQPQFTVAGQVQPQMQYGQTNTTAPAGALTPLNPVQQPAAEPAIPTATPKPVDPVVQAKLDAYAAEERRKQLAFDNQQRRLDAEHQAKLDKQVSAAKPKTTTKETVVAQPITSPAEIPSTDVASRQATQPMVEAGTIKPGKAYGSTDVLDQAALKSQPLIQTEKQLEAAGQSKPASKTKAPVVASAEKVAEAAEKAKLKWPGGSEGSALQQFFGATKKTLSPEHMASLEMFKDYVGGSLAPSTGGTIKEISQANEFVKKYSGSPLPMGENGKLARLPDEQIAKVNEGIRTELEDAVKGGKLSKLGKGAMAAAALLGLTEAVQAAQKGDFGPLRQAGFDIGGPVLAGKIGLGMLSKAGGAGFAAATYAGGLNEGEQRELARRRYEFEKESKKLGSPYRSVPPPR